MLAAPITVYRQWGTVASSTASGAKTPASPMEAVSIAWVNLSIGLFMVVLLMLYDVRIVRCTRLQSDCGERCGRRARGGTMR